MEKEKLCFGVFCKRHGECQRYLDVDKSNSESKFIGTCQDYERKSWPQFIQAPSKVVWLSP